MKFNLVQISGIVTIMLTTLLVFYFVQTRKQKNGNSIYLAGILGVYALMIVCSLILSSGINHKLFLLAHIANQSIFLIGPLMFFYAQSYINPGKKILKKDMLHVVPYLFATAYLAIKLFYVHIPITCRANHIMLGSASFMHSMGYFYTTVQNIRESETAINSSGAKLDSRAQKWLRFIVLGFFSILLIKMAFFVVWDISGYYSGCNEIVNLYFLTSFMLINIFTYFLLVKPQFFEDMKKYKHSVLKEDEKEQFKEQLITLLETEKIYRNPLISLSLLAKKLSIPSRYLSQIINETLNKTYYELISWYRIRECMEQLADEDSSHKTILEIAYDAGFNSKSTFNSAFIKHTGITPKEFRNNSSKVEHMQIELCSD